MVYKFFDKESSSRSGAATESNYQLVNKMDRQIVRIFKRRKVYSSFRNNIWGVDFANMQSLKNTAKELDIYCVQLICLVNMHGLFI